MVSYYINQKDSDGLQKLDSYREGAWVSVEEPTQIEIDQLVDQFDLDAGHLADALDADEMPRLEREGDTTYIFVRYAFADDYMELTTAPLLFVLGPKVFITVALKSLPRMQYFTSGKVVIDSSQNPQSMLAIMNQIVNQYEVFINNISRQIKAIRTRLKTHEVSNQDFIDFVLIEDELNEFLSALQPTTAILRRLLLGRHFKLNEPDRELVEDLLLNNEQSIEGCLSNVKSVINIREAYATIASNNLNRTMKILTAATVILTLPTIFFSMYGMNVNLPLQQSPLAFSIVVVTTVVVMVAVVLFGRWRKLF